MIKKFLTLEEAAQQLGLTPDGLRQGFETGLADELPAYLNLGVKNFYACIYGGIAKTRKDSLLPTICLDNGQTISMYSLDESDLKFDQLGDELADINFSHLTSKDTDCSATVRLSGYFRIVPGELKGFARQGGYELYDSMQLPFRMRLEKKILRLFDLMDKGAIEQKPWPVEISYGLSVAPSSWWSADGPFAKTGDGDPWITFGLIAPKTQDCRREIEFSELLFRIEDVEALKPKAKNTAKTAPLRSDAEENYIRIIAGLWAQTELSEKPYSAAEALVGELKLLDWDKPGRDTIASALTQAAALLKGKHPKFR